VEFKKCYLYMIIFAFDRELFLPALQNRENKVQ
jgi:hypothetical protein